MNKKIKITEGQLTNIVKAVVQSVHLNNELSSQIITETTQEVINNIRLFESTSLNNFKEVKYFSPDGQTMPNGIGFQRGNFLKECRDNAKSFIIDEAIHNKQYGLSDYRGGIIVFSTDVTLCYAKDVASSCFNL